MNLEIKINKFYLGLGLFVILVSSSLLLFVDQTNSITAQPNENENKKSEKNNKNGATTTASDLTTIKTKINLNNIDIKNHDSLKIVGYLNGEGKTAYVDLKKDNNNINLQDNSLTVDLKFKKSNDISQVMFDDEYYVCGYVLDAKLNARTAAATTSNPPLYDCDEGNIGLTSTDKDTVKLFYTLNKYNESTTLYKTSGNLPNTQKSPKDVKITINVPIFDSKNIKDMYVVAMVKGENQIKKVNVQNELGKEGEGGKSNSNRLAILFTFDRNTEVGPIERGDMFFGCVTSDDFPDQNSDCEKKVIKDLYKVADVCARKDSSCK